MTAAVVVTASAARPPSPVQAETRSDGVTVVTIGETGDARDLGAELAEAVDRARSNAKVRAIVVRSARAAFTTGGSVEALRGIKFADDARDEALRSAERFARLANGREPVVACVEGAAIGRGLELALACTAAVASDDPRTVFGLRDVKVGLVPDANGLLRVAKRAGLRAAIDLALDARTLRAGEALGLGLVDEVVAAPIVLDVACELARTLAERPKKRAALARLRRLRSARGVAAAKRALIERTPFGIAWLFRRARAGVTERTRGHYAAEARILDVLERYAWRGFRSAAALEARVFGELVVSETSRRLVESSLAIAALDRDTGLEPHERALPSPVRSVAVLGAGLMGAGIACATVRAGLPVRMKDRDDAALGRGLKYVRDALASDRSLTPRERDAMFSRLSGTLDSSGLRHADVVIEAVFEDLALKHAVLREVEPLVSESCVVASNTAMIPIARVAEAARRPERVVGMHYGRPAQERPLVEIVRTKAADPRAVAAAVGLAKSQGKTVIVVRDVTGFYTTRILTPYLEEAAHLAAEGAAIDAVDDALVDWGMTAGPMETLDDLGIDVAAHVAAATHAAFGERLRPPRALESLVADDRRGRKNGRGFYLYRVGKHGKVVDPTVYDALRVAPTKTALAEDLSLRCSLAMVNEALRCLDEGVIRSARDGDVGAVLGAGFPAFRGGPFRYVDVVGADEILRRTRSLEQRFGERFEPAPLLVDMARRGRRFYG